jgi:hypothetical protein
MTDLIAAIRKRQQCGIASEFEIAAADALAARDALIATLSEALTAALRNATFEATQ